MKRIRKTLSSVNIYRIFLGLAILEGCLALWFLFKIRSETKNASLFNFSLQRLGIGFAILLGLGVLILALADSIRSKRLLKILTTRLETILGYEVAHIIFKTTISIILVSSLASLLFYWFPGLQNLIFFLPNNYIFAVIGERAGYLMGWIFLISLKILLLYFISGKKANDSLALPFRLMVIAWIVEAFVVVLFVLWSLISRKLSPEEFTEPAFKILILAIWFTTWTLVNRDKKWANKTFHLFVCISLGLCVFLVSLQFAQWFHVWGPRPEDHFILQADAFRHGKLYLLKVPSDTHDLNFFNGNWYESKPPFPILLITPLVAIWGVHAFNINTFSLLLSALAAVTIYLIFYQLKKLGWIRLSFSGAIWLTILFSFGTVYWWLSIEGTVGPFSQVVTVFFCALAFFSVLEKWSPWVTGICLMAAIMSRPNVFVLWPALASIFIQLNLEEGKVKWKDVIKWSVPAVIPGILGAGLLLYYNFLRYGTFTDFGYGTLNGSLQIVQNVQNYGLFSPHFIPINLRVMFLALPKLAKQCTYFFPRGDGISILMSTPAIIYLLRRFNLSWWIGGCWCSILLSIALLAMYSNTGANQYAYRYLMDFFIPAIMIIAFNVGEKISGLMKGLIIASIIVNYYGTVSSMSAPC